METPEGNHKIKVIGKNWPQDSIPTEEVIMVVVHSTPKVLIKGQTEAMDPPADFKFAKTRTGDRFEITFVASNAVNHQEKTAVVLIGEWISKLSGRTVLCPVLK